MVKQPSLQMASYNDEWVHHSLSEITVKIGSGKTPLGGATAYKDSGIPLIRSQNVNHDCVDLSDVAYIDNETDAMMSSSRVQYNDVLLNITGASIGRSAVYKSTEPANVNQHVCIIRPVNSFSPDYIQIMLASDVGQKQIETNQAGGAREGLNFEQIGRLNFCFPDYNHQEKLGLYFSQLEHLIALYQRKLDTLLSVRKSMLQKMFPRNGSKVPEIRFKGFEGEWEESYLYDYLDVSSELNSDNRYSREEVLSVSGEYGIVNQIDLLGRSFAGASISNYGVVHTGDIVYTKSPLNSNPYGIIKTNKGKDGIVSTLYAVYHARSNTYPSFVQSYFDLDDRMNRYMQPLVNKGAKNDMKVTAENALKGKVLFPSYQEQVAISNFYTGCELLIQKQHQRVQAYIKLKQSLLSRMFV